MNKNNIKFTDAQQAKAIYNAIVKPTSCTNFWSLFYIGVTICMFRTVFPSIIRSSRLYIQTDTATVCLQAVAVSVWHCLLLYVQSWTPQAVAVSVWHMPVAVCTVLKSWWWTERPSETCRVLFQNKINLRHWCI